ncbi:uncharacterized protein G6M90_00g036240 [Metarhizium brunneum]|uniref:Uncharacterized protein n=1 Tax=Metarhizium brunneum TaxID=500148 RepID=A0A7D5YRB0_9HYPO|nr:hypothetical protein G6M90_00g036240 [Metarhizium brunneum]
MTPGSSLALLILGIMSLVGLVFWFFKSQINKYVSALLAYKRRLTDTEQAAEDSTAATSS